MWRGRYRVGAVAAGTPKPDLIDHLGHDTVANLKTHQVHQSSGGRHVKTMTIVAAILIIQG
jgi:hypothetical protein